MLLVQSIGVSSAATTNPIPDEVRRAQEMMRDGNYDDAFATVVPLADVGEPSAQYILGRLHLRPKFSAFAPHEAARLIEAAAKAGYTPAQHDFAELLRRGLGTERDALSAFQWHLRAAKQQYRMSEMAIAAMYQSGEGVAKNAQQSKQWSARALRPRDRSGKQSPADASASGALISSGLTTRAVDQQTSPLQSSAKLPPKNVVRSKVQRQKIEPTNPQSKTMPKLALKPKQPPKPEPQKLRQAKTRVAITSKPTSAQTAQQAGRTEPRYILQFGAFRGLDGAERRRKKLNQALRDANFSVELNIRTVTREDAPLYLLSTAGNDTAEATAARCASFERAVKGLDCFTKRAR